MANALSMESIKHIHFVGIGGAGMGGIAEVLKTQGYDVSGSDMINNAVTQHLQKLGVRILSGHHSDHIAGADMVVYSSAIPKDNPELLAARKAQIPVIARGEMLAEIMRRYFGIAIAGTHGKTTTTGLVATVLLEGGLDPTYVIGGMLMCAKTHAHSGGGKYFVAEADESDASFLYMQPKVAVITNIDKDHLNNYRDFSHLKQTFLEFIHRLPKDGLAVLCSDDEVVQEILPQIKRPFITYGFQSSDSIRAMSYQQKGVRCEIDVQREKLPSFIATLNLPGRHNVLNALAAIAIGSYCGVSDELISRALAKYQGTGRRFQMYGELPLTQGKQVLLIDDYGHHPREIAATVEAIRKAWPNRRLVVAFQPHRYTRTQAIFNDFIHVLSLPDVLLLLEIYSAGEEPIPGISSHLLGEAIAKQSLRQPIYIQEPQELPEVLSEILKDGDILLVQGAGDIGKMAVYLAQKAQEK